MAYFGYHLIRVCWETRFQNAVISWIASLPMQRRQRLGDFFWLTFSARQVYRVFPCVDRRCLAKIPDFEDRRRPARRR